ncbi:conserved Plasmodium protein, unknown function [Plasmodium vivax]|nr:conserved Plasmodium protein, unknown function [Plasmodium vivax]
MKLPLGVVLSVMLLLGLICAEGDPPKPRRRDKYRNKFRKLHKIPTLSNDSDRNFLQMKSAHIYNPSIAPLRQQLHGDVHHLLQPPDVGSRHVPIHVHTGEQHRGVPLREELGEQRAEEEAREERHKLLRRQPDRALRVGSFARFNRVASFAHFNRLSCQSRESNPPCGWTQTRGHRRGCPSPLWITLNIEEDFFFFPPSQM